MGIKQLSKLIKEKAPDAIRENTIKHYFNRVLAIDASMSLYSFLISIRTDVVESAQLKNSEGKVTSHLSGMFYRTINLLENGIKPVFVFDGKPPELKQHVLKQRGARREKAESQLKDALKEQDKTEILKMEKRLVKVKAEETEETMLLLKLMGVPVIQAPCEAEAQCAFMCKTSKVYGVATEDMDALTFGCPILLRNVFAPAKKAKTIVQYDLETLLSRLELTMEQFIDLCILCGCDYTEKIKGVGPHRALELIRKHKNVENILRLPKFSEEKDKVKYEEAREMFKNHEVDKQIKLVWKPAKEDEIIDLMVNKNGFNLQRIQNGLLRIKKATKKGGQTRMDSFFKPIETKTKKSAKTVTKKKRRV